MPKKVSMHHWAVLFCSVVSLIFVHYFLSTISLKQLLSSSRVSQAFQKGNRSPRHLASTFTESQTSNDLIFERLNSRSLTGFESVENDSTCCKFPDGCSIFCPVHSPNYTPPDCSTSNQVVCLKGKHKSGTTWTEYLVSGLMELVCEENPDKCKYHVQPVVDSKNFAQSYYLFVDGKKRLTVTAYDQEVSGCFKHKLPMQEYGNILVLRDPRDVMVSRHFYTNQRGDKLSLSYALKELKELNRWMKGTVSSAQAMRKDNSGGLQVVRYEELNKESIVVMKQLFDFLSLSCITEFSDELAERVYDRYAFEKLTKKEETKDGVIGSQRTGRTKKMREGKYFQFAKHFKPQDLAKVENALHGNAEFNAISLPYYKKELKRIEKSSFS